MSRYLRDSVDRVRDAIDMVELVSAKTELRRAGPARYTGLCPFHDERTPSFGINPADKVYYCFGCQASGDAFTFVQETEGLDFKEAVEVLAERYGVQLEVEEEDPQAAARRQRRERLHELLERTAAFYVRYLWESEEAGPARRYLASRGLQEAALREFRVGYAPSAWNKVHLVSHRAGYSFAELHDAGLVQRGKGGGRIYDRFRRRIMFPLADVRGRVLGFGARAMGADQQPKYLNTSDSELFHKGRMVFAADLARAAAARAGEVIVAEGYTDVIALHQAGLRNTVAIMGTSMTEEQVGELARMAPRVLLALDADAAGQEAMVRAARVAAGRKLELRVVPLPSGSDPADLVAASGARAMTALAERSVPFVRFRVERALATGDLSTAEGKDAVIADLRPVFATLPESVMRQELLHLVAERMDVGEDLVTSLLKGGGGARGTGRPRGAVGGGAVAGHRGGSSRPAPAPGFSGSAGYSGPSGGPGSSGRSGAAGRPGSAGRDGDPGPQAPPGPHDDAGAHDASFASAPVDPALAARERQELLFLAFCLARSDLGRPTLAALEVERDFASVRARRAALHLRDHLDDPIAGLGDDDQDLTPLMHRLSVQAAGVPSSTAAFHVERLQLALARAERDMAEARREGRPIWPLRKRKDELHAELTRAQDEALAE